ncbi:ATP-binding protein [Paraglaciecola aquimarina]|uniref:ATP-binding protein n=1 Tax=Paraglaciecola aquimarina TaxID=1235557 RepID=A0ABU3SWA5_9ALTE|nr:ATP-binding protein [Paraglaciecola aquimarina]MDU0354273.1 ATP-binding protein [Paraglaciecola aquimarina]
MKFKISSGLKNIIGKDLIVNDFVAIFELVKNSFDAYADRVELFFGNNCIYIIDNGKGMSKDDLINKWLFVAYSAKSDNTEDIALAQDYRTNLRATRKSYAGNKGVGRFSCDRLGLELNIQSKSLSDDVINNVYIDWRDFEADQNNQFQDVKVNFKTTSKFSLPSELSDLSLKTGTVLKISNIREENSWDRNKLKKLKSSIAKLIDPFGVKKDFDIYLHAPDELEKDKDEYTKLKEKFKKMSY